VGRREKKGGRKRRTFGLYEGEEERGKGGTSHWNKKNEAKLGSSSRPTSGKEGRVDTLPPGVKAKMEKTRGAFATLGPDQRKKKGKKNERS